MKPTLTLAFDNMAALAAFVAKNSDMPAAAPVGETASPQMINAPSVPAPAAPVANNEDDENSTPDANAPDVDADGLRWDERIHAPSKGQNKDGTWRKKKKLDDAFVAQVEAELRQSNTSPAPAMQPTPTPAAAPVQQTTAPPMPQVDQQQPAPAMQQTAPPMPQVDQQQPAPAMQPAPTPAAAPVQQQQPAPAAEGIDFHTFMQQLSAQMQKRDANGHPVINADYLAQATSEIANAFGSPLSAITDVASNPQMITYAVQVFQRDGKWG